MEKPTMTKVVVSGIVWNRDALLLLQRARDFNGIKQGRKLWEPPGGAVEIGENIPETLRRELLEETGICSATSPALAAVCHYTVEDEEIVMHRFHILYAVPLSETAGVRLSKEHADYCWVDSAERLAGLEMIPALGAVLHQALMDRAVIQRWT